MNIEKTMETATHNRFTGCPPPPRFITHEEIEDPQSLQRLSRLDESRRQDEDDLVLFKRMHACACRMSRMWNRARRPSAAQKKRYLRLHAEYLRIRDVLTNRHLGLVYGLLRRFRTTAVELDDLRSEGLMALLRSVDSFNPWRGFRFSTYACNAILRAFSQAASRQSRRLPVWLTTMQYEGLESSDWPERRNAEELTWLSERLHKALADNRTDLSATERMILEERFLSPDNERPLSLEQLGDRLHLSKERVRQIQQGSLLKLRRALQADPMLKLRELDSAQAAD
jgi:RNA polymerase sigma factor (sigma-70 family)